MKKSVCCPPVLFLIFNRPDLTQRVFERIRQAAPQQLFIAADGPRPDVPTDVELCAQARQIVEQVDWECEAYTLFRETNLGCKRAVSSAIDWFFEHVEEGIILEDDCVPHPTFFRFCAELLERYRDDERIMAISGDNFQKGRQRTPYSYYFSRFVHIWGWATWRRAWQHYDHEMKLWPTLRETAWLLDILGDRTVADHRRRMFEKVYAGEIDTWDYAWTFSCWAQNGLTILPEVNLVSNIGFGDGATHTKSGSSKVANLPTTAIRFPLRHPPYVVRNYEADQFTLKHVFQPRRSESKRFHRRMMDKVLGPVPNGIHFTRRVIRKVRNLARIRKRGLTELVNRWRYREYFRRYESLPRMKKDSCWCGGELTILTARDAYGVCRRCGTYVLRHPPDPSHLTDIYSLKSFWKAKARLRGIATIEERSALYLADGRLDYWLSIIEQYVSPQGRVIEVGCAPGILLQQLSDRGYECLGAELTEDTAAWIREHTGLDVITGVFPDVELPSCDLFLAFDVLEHVYDPVAFMRGISRVLNPNGVAVIQSPIVRPEQGYDVTRPFGQDLGRMLDGTEHVFIFTSEAIQRLADVAGLIVVDNTARWRQGHEIVVLRKVP